VNASEESQVHIHVLLTDCGTISLKEDRWMDGWMENVAKFGKDKIKIIY